MLKVASLYLKSILSWTNMNTIKSPGTDTPYLRKNGYMQGPCLLPFGSEALHFPILHVKSSSRWMCQTRQDAISDHGFKGVSA